MVAYFNVHITGIREVRRVCCPTDVFIRVRQPCSAFFTDRQYWPISRHFGESSIFNPTFIGYEETSSYWSVQFFSAFHWSPSIGTPRMTVVSFIKTTESYKVC